MNIAVRNTNWNGAALINLAVTRRSMEHELLWTCYLSGQLTGADLEAEIAADPAFGDFVTAREQGRN